MVRQQHPRGAGDPLRPAGFEDRPHAGKHADDPLQRPGSGVTGPSGPVVDPELETDLGPELELRGDTLEAELEAARDEATACRDRALRAQAEFDNYRKRVMRDQQDMVNRAGERIIGEVLPVIDNLERAIEHVTAGGDVRQLLAGVEGVHRQLLGVLAKEGVNIIDPFGQPFDPVQHQAMAQREEAEVPEGTVVDVYQKGYEMHGKVIRPAMVVVSAGQGPGGKE
jgi:molecular chaperone GrpE